MSETTNQSEVKAPEVKLDPMQKSGVLQAVAQLEMFSQMFATAPKRVVDACKEFIDSLKEWAQ